MDLPTYCKDLTRASKTNFYYSFLFLPKPKREAIYAVYAFCRLLDDSVDTPGPLHEKTAALKKWREELDNCYTDQSTHPVTKRLSEEVRRFAIPKVYFDEIISGVEMDLVRNRYATFEDLYQYCYRVASCIGLVCIEIFGYKDPRVKEYAVTLGVAFQLTNILRDLKSDLSRGRIYLPREDLTLFHYSEEDFFLYRYNPPFIEMMQFEAERARRYYQEAERLLPPYERRAMVAAEIMGKIYSRILQEIEHSRFNVFEKKITLPTSQKAIIAFSTWIKNRWIKNHATR